MGNNISHQPAVNTYLQALYLLFTRPRVPQISQHRKRKRDEDLTNLPPAKRPPIPGEIDAYPESMGYEDPTDLSPQRSPSSVQETKTHLQRKMDDGPIDLPSTKWSPTSRDIDTYAAWKKVGNSTDLLPAERRPTIQNVNPRLKRKRDEDPTELPPAKRAPIHRGIVTVPDLSRWKGDEDSADLSPMERRPTGIQCINPHLKRKKDEDPTELPPAKRAPIHRGIVTVPDLSRWKGDEDSADLSPTERRPTGIQCINPHLKRKRDEDPTELPPAKRAPIPGEIAPESEDLTDLSPMKCRPTGIQEINLFPNVSNVSLLILPNELLYKIVDLLEVKDLWTCTRVCVILKHIAAPRYLSDLNFAPKGRFWASVDEKNCEALMVWRRMADFTCPRNVYCSIFDAKDSHLQSLRIFFESPQCANIPIIYLSCFGQASLASTAALLTSIRASGCQTLSYTGRSDPLALSTKFLPKSSSATPSRLRSFSSGCNKIFAPPVIPFTLSTLRNSPLRVLSLQDVGLSATMWGKLLRSLDLPLLRDLEVDRQCSITTLLTFLQRHSRTESLRISVYGESKKIQRPRHLPVHLPSLKALRGPPEYLTLFLKYLDHPSSIIALKVDLGNVKPSIPQISKMLDCAQYLPHLRDMSIYFLGDSNNLTTVIPMTALLVPKYESRTCGAIQLTISAAFDTITDGEGEIMKSCAVWMKSFPDVKRVKLVLGRVASSEAEVDEVRNAFMANTIGSDEVNIVISTC